VASGLINSAEIFMLNQNLREPSKTAKCFIYLAIILIANISFLFSPPLPAEIASSKYVTLNKYMRLPVNGDSFAFIGGAIDPSCLFRPNYFRQSRPGFIIMGTLAGYSVYFISYPFRSAIRKIMKEKFTAKFGYRDFRHPLELYASAYLGYIFINLIVLLISFFLFGDIVKRLPGVWQNGQLLLYALFFLIVSNQLTKYTFWIPHDQMFNILTPILCLDIGINFQQNNLSLRKIMLLSLSSGILILVYGSFLLPLPLILFCYAVSIYKKKRITQRIILNLASISAVFFFPTLLWVMTLKLSGLHLYSAEIMEFRQFIWIWDAIKEPGSSLFSALYAHTISFIKTFSSLIFMAALFIFSALYSRYNPLKSLTDKDNVDYHGTWVLVAFVMAEFLLFYWALGYYADRLTFSIAQIFLFCIAACLKQKKIAANFKYLLISIIIASHFYTIFYNPLYFSKTFFK
jgi:hypothetical protein